MKIPYVIDNQTHRLADVLSDILGSHFGKSLDVATAYFNVQGFRLLQQGLLALGSFRLLLGDEPSEAAQVGLRPRAAAALLDELNATIYSGYYSPTRDGQARFVSADAETVPAR
jgi:hypothetical protein